MDKADVLRMNAAGSPAIVFFLRACSVIVDLGHYFYWTVSFDPGAANIGQVLKTDLRQPA
jgi:hypothetical protein